MNVIQGVDTAGWKWNRLLDVVVTILKYKKSTIDHSIYINVFYDGIESQLTVSTDNVIDTNNTETEFTELRRVFEEYFGIKVQ